MTAQLSLDTSDQPGVDAGLLEKFEALQQMKASQLQDLYFDLFDRPTPSRNRAWLVRRLIYRIQEQESGFALGQEAQERINELSQNAVLGHRKLGAVPKKEKAPKVEKARDPRLPPAGTTIVRLHQGVEHRIEVLDQGFNYLDRTYKSLSQIAKEVTGTRWNGFIWAGLGKTKKGI